MVQHNSGWMMIKRGTIREYRNSLRSLVDGYKEQQPHRKRYRGFLPRNLRNYIVGGRVQCEDIIAETAAGPRHHYYFTQEQIPPMLAIVPHKK